MKVLGYLLLIPAGIGNAILRGYVLSVLWAWFIVSQFAGMPHLGVVTATGVAVTIGLFRSPSLTDKETWEILNNTNTETMPLKGRWIQTVVYAAVSLISLFSGWIWHHFM